MVDELIQRLMDYKWFLIDHPTWFYTASLALGLVVGSFLNVVIHRLPLMMERAWRDDALDILELPPEKVEPLSLARPGSHCPKCRKSITAWENIPVLSYLVLRGRCSGCGARISWRYPGIEALTGALTLWIAWSWGVSAATGAGWVLTWCLIALVFIDMDRYWLPDTITLPVLWLGILLALGGVFVDIQTAVIGAVLGYLTLWSINFAFFVISGKQGMGAGDFKMMAMLGAWMGWQMLPLVLAGASIGGMVIALIQGLLGHQTENRLIPFGPYLALAGWLVLISADSLFIKEFVDQINLTLLK